MAFSPMRQNPPTPSTTAVMSPVSLTTTSAMVPITGALVSGEA
jgi:hypothetical protein